MKQQINRFLCWEEAGMQKASGISLVAHKPVKRNLALVCDDLWEGKHNGYAGLVKTEGGYRLYYRASGYDPSFFDSDGVICVAESKDGITFRKLNVGTVTFEGTKNNNIVFTRSGHLDNFAVFYDENPACPADARYKALSYMIVDGKRCLMYYASEDGLSFREMYPLDVAGTFDSYNVMLWNCEQERYELYYRGFHTVDGEDRWDYPLLDPTHDIRDVRCATSKDFVHWESHGRIAFAEGQSDQSLYTNQIQRYYRAPNTYLGFPVRYADRVADAHSFADMPTGDRHQFMMETAGREGSAVTDCLIMTSQDGRTFLRRDEAFFTPGPENRYNWWYGNCYFVYGMCETPAEEEGAPNEISLYVGENYRLKNVNFRRMTVRQDGFFSYYAPYCGGELLTVPITVTGEQMYANLATSAAGGVTFTLCDEQGIPIEGYQSGVHFGDTVHRRISFDAPLSALCGKQVTVRVTLKDAHLYSFCFE